jgi:eukaryotic-like serine/threonine-protein kinase
MAAKDHDRNLLFGILALQMDFISRDALVSAMHSWVLAKDKLLGDILVEQKALAADSRDLLDALVRKHLAMHDNDPEKSLAAVSSVGTVREDLRRINDPEVQASLLHVSAAHPPVDPYAATHLFAGSSTSKGTRFRILRPYAVGGLGKVSVARDEELCREVALKEIQEQFAVNPDIRARFLLEAEITGGLEHPGVVPVYGLGQYADGRPYYAMRFIRGDSLKEAIARYHDPKAGKSNASERAVELRKLLGRFVDVCNAIAYAHSRGVLHRDLKPGNIILGKYGETLVVDWGLAKPMDRPEADGESSQVPIRPSSGSSSVSTLYGAAIGTPRYMSPEQAAGRLDLLGPASDVYNLGATLYSVLTGRPPIEGDDNPAILKDVEQGRFRAPRAVNPEVPPPLESICLKAMALRPADRYSSPQALADDIEHWLADEPVKAHRDSLLARLSRITRRHKVATAAVAALLLAAVVGLSIGTVLLGREQAHTDRARKDAIAAQATTEQANHKLENTNLDLDVARKDARRQLALSYIDRGVNELEHGDPLLGYATLGKAYQATSDAPDLRLSVRLLLAGWDRAAPRVFEHEVDVHFVSFSPDGTTIATASLGGARLWDAATGKLLGEPFTNGWVNSVSFSPDGTKIATASADNTARLWDVATRKPLGESFKHDGNVNSVSFSPDGTKIATASEDKTARLWDVATGRLIGAPLKHDSSVNSVSFSPDGTKIATASWSTVRLWDLATGKPIGAPLKHGTKVQSVSFSPDGTKIAFASNLVNIDIGEVRLCDVATAKPIGERLQHDARVLSVSFSPDSTKIATASADGTVRLWDTAIGKTLGTLPKHHGKVNSVSFSPDGTKIATASDDHTARLWDVATGKSLGTLPKNGAGFSPDGMKLATASDEHTVRLSDVATGKPIGAPLMHDAKVRSVTFSPDSTRVVTASWNDARIEGEARLWDVATGRPLGTPLKHDGVVYSASFSPDGTKVATACNDDTARLWDVATGKPLGEPLRHGSSVFSVSFSPDGKKVATRGGGRARVWDVATGKSLGEPLKNGWVNSVSFSPDGTKIATACGVGTETGWARLWDVATRKPLGEPFKHDGKVNSVSFSHDGTKVATASDDKTARLWDVATGKLFVAPLKHDSSVNSVSFSSDGTTVVTASDDHTVRLWDVATGKIIGSPFKHDGKVNSVSFSHDGTNVATASEDNTARLWDVATGKPLGKPLKHDFQVNSVLFSPDATKVATASADYTARLWDVATGNLLGTPLEHHGTVNSVSFSSDGTKIATGSDIGVIGVARLWDAATGKPLGKPLQHYGKVRSVSFSCNGTKIATSVAHFGNEHVRLWDVATGEPLGRPIKLDSVVNSVSFSPDETMIATASDDHTVRLWDVATGKPLGEPLRHDSSVNSVSFSPDGTKIATASDDNTARLWDVTTRKRLGPPLWHYCKVDSVSFSPDGTRVVTTGSDRSDRLWDLPKPVPDDPSWIAAYVRTVSQRTEDADSTLHPLSPEDADSSSRELLTSSAWLQERSKRLEESRRTLHVVDAEEQETAENWFAAAFHLRWLAKLEPENTEWPRRLAKTQRAVLEIYWSRGRVTFQSGQAKDSIQNYQKALVIAERLAKANPNKTQAQCDVVFTYYRLGCVTLKLGQAKEARAYFEKAERIAASANDSLEFYFSASGYALLSASGEKDGREKDALRAIELLREAIAQGYDDVADMKQDTDLDSLREREDFKKLVSELEKTAGAKK